MLMLRKRSISLVTGLYPRAVTAPRQDRAGCAHFTFYVDGAVSAGNMLDIEKLVEEIRKFPVLYDQTSEKYRNTEHKEKIWNNISATLGATGGVEECKKKWASIRDQLRRTLQKRRTKSGHAASRNHKYKYEDILEFLIPHMAERDPLSNGLISEKHDDERDETESIITDAQEEFTERICKLHNVSNINEEPETEVKNQLTQDNSFKFSSQSSGSASSSSVKKDKYAKSNAVISIKRKASCEEQPLDSPASQLMAYVIAEKEAENKRIRQTLQDSAKHPVDAFLCGIAPTLKSLNPILQNQAKSKIFSVVQDFEMTQLMSKYEQDVRNPKPSSSHIVMLSPSSSSSHSVTTNAIPCLSPLGVETTYRDESMCTDNDETVYYNQ